MSEPGEDTAGTVHAAAERYRNWDRWGPDDQRGTLNSITSDKVLEAVGRVRRGDVVSLALPFDATGPQTGELGRVNPLHTMTFTGTDAAAGVQDFLPHGFGAADDTITMPLQCGTQWDGLSHIFDRGLMWNGYPATDVTGLDGARRNGIEQVADGFVSRGVLLDIARHCGVPSLDPGFAITERLLLECIDAQGESAHIGQGDIVLVRTGFLGARRRDGWGDYAGGDAPGLSFDTADWLYRTEIAAIATDTWGVEVRPNELEDSFQPLHQVMVPNMGLFVGEIFALDELAERCAGDGVYDFLFVAPPLPVTGAVGSPANPQAIR